MFATKLICSWIGAFGLAAGAFCQDNILVFSPSDRPFTGVHVAGVNERGVIAGDFVTSKGGGRVTYGFVRDSAGHLTVFDPPITGADIGVNGINAGGAVTGTYAIGNFHGFVRNADGSFVTFDVPGSAGTYPMAINGEGVVTGFTAVPGSTSGFLRNPDGSFTLFDPPGSIYTNPVDINIDGSITGWYQTADQSAHGFLRYALGTFISIDAPAGTLTEARSINAMGTITGNYSKLGRGFGFVRDTQGNITSFDPGFFPVGNSISNEGVITGSLFLTSPPRNTIGFVRYPDGTIHLLMPADAIAEPGSNLQLPCTALNAKSINNQGIVTGECTAGNSVYGFVFYP